MAKESRRTKREREREREREKERRRRSWSALAAVIGARREPDEMS
jgi:hypothetical protein